MATVQDQLSAQQQLIQQASQSLSGKFEVDLLQRLGAPITSANLAFIGGWIKREGTAATNNPLATTYSNEPGASPLPGNPAGVEQYPSEAIGVDATARTLLGGYPHIVSGLRAGNPRFTIDVGNELLKWSGGGYSSFTPTAGYPSVYTGPGAVPGAKQIAEAASGIGSALSFPERAFAFLTSWRFVEILGGFLLLLVGLYLLGRQFGAPVPTPGFIAATGQKAQRQADSTLFQSPPGAGSDSHYQANRATTGGGGARAEQISNRPTPVYSGRARAGVGQTDEIPF